MTRGPAAGRSSRTSTTSSRTANSSCAAWLEVLTLCSTTLPVSISSASERKSCAVRAWSRPKACFPAFLAHSKAFIMLFLPDTYKLPHKLRDGKSSSWREAASPLMAKALSEAKRCSSRQHPNHTQRERQKASAISQFLLIFLTWPYNEVPWVFSFFWGIHMGNGRHVVYEFGEFQLDLTRQLLWHHGEQVVLAPKVFETLLVLVRNSGRTLGKEELIQALWPETFVEEGNLSQNIFLLRKALGDDRNGHSFIHTVPKKGYRFIAPVTEIEATTSGADPHMANFWRRHSPFRSLQVFEPEDAWLFFGRDAET